MKCNISHFQQAHNTIACNDKTYKELRKDNVREKTLKGNMTKEDCQNERMCRFLKLLKQPEGRSRKQTRGNMTREKWRKVAKQSKRRSASSAFSKRTHAAHECALESERMTNVLMLFCNTILKNRHYPKR